MPAPPPPPADADLFPKGTKIGARFLIERFESEDSLGAVYEARDGKTNKPVALRILSKELLDSTGSRLLRKSCRAAAQRSEEHTSELQPLDHISYAVFCLKKKKAYRCEVQ